ncbi:MAG: hypothetical protein BWY87_00358 [Deltaproteobacteria bacterium ADurb.Bin510]|nr:MAG: hypothetical protein BWY87_00358 [Deltaproteobacteria bacterium ADurb.Bin510]
MAGASDISTILSNSGRIERINPNTFAHQEAARQVLTEGEARERMRRNRSVNEGKESQTIITRERQRREAEENEGREHQLTDEDAATEEASESSHLIDLVV